MTKFMTVAESVVSKLADCLDFEDAVFNTVNMMTQRQIAMLKDQSEKLWDRHNKSCPEGVMHDFVNLYDRADEMLKRRKIAAGQELVKRQRREAAREEQASFDRMMSAH
jgi:hypothetical protein